MDSQSPNEEWRPVVGYEGHYEVSSCGKVRSIDREILTLNGRRVKLKGKELALSDSLGYKSVNLSKGNEQRSIKVHVLVAKAFLGDGVQGSLVRHLNDVRTDNRLENLSYGTQVDNMADMERNAGHYESKRTTCPRGHSLELPNLTAASLRAGRRLCLACNRAKGFLQKKPERAHEFEELSDVYYRKIMENG